MRLGNVVCAVLIPATFGCNPLRPLELVCRQSARIEIHDPAAWATYLAAATAVDLQTQRSIAQGRLTGQIKAPPDLQPFIRPFPYVEGYKLVDHLQPESSDRPYAKVTQVMGAGKAIATVHDFEMKMENFGYTDFPTCSRDHPEVFGLRRTVIDHY